MPGWHRADIIAALHKLGTSLEALGLAHGKARSSLGAALFKPSRGCNLIIADTIGVPLHELWPAWFDRRGQLIWRDPMRAAQRPSSQKRTRKLMLTRARA